VVGENEESDAVVDNVHGIGDSSGAGVGGASDGGECGGDIDSLVDDDGGENKADDVGAFEGLDPPATFFFFFFGGGVSAGSSSDSTSARVEQCDGRIPAAIAAVRPS